MVEKLGNTFTTAGYLSVTSCIYTGLHTVDRHSFGTFSINHGLSTRRDHENGCPITIGHGWRTN